MEKEEVMKDIRFKRRLMRQLISMERQKAFEESGKSCWEVPVESMVRIQVGWLFGLFLIGQLVSGW